MFISSSSECFAVSWSFRSISDCAQSRCFGSILSTLSLRERGFDTRHLSSYSDIVHLGGHWHIRHGVCAHRGLRSATSVRCLLDLQLVSLESRLRTLLGPCLVVPWGSFFTSFCSSPTATVLRCAVYSWIHHSASQDSRCSWIHRKPVASLRPVHGSLAQTG